MGQSESKNPVRAIENDVAEIRRSIRHSKGKLNSDTKEQLQRVLVNYSQQVNANSKKAKRKDVDKAQKLIAEVTSELILDRPPEEETLDLAAVETSSFIHVPKGEKPPPSYQPKIVTNPVTDSECSTLIDVENKITSLKLDAKVAISNNDKHRLRILKKSLENLATNLEMIPVDNSLDLSDKKRALEKTLQSLYTKIIKAKKQMDRESNIDYLTTLHDTQKTNKMLDDLTKIQTALTSLILTNQSEELEALRVEVNQYKNQVNAFEEVSREIQTKKQEVGSLIENLLHDIEVSLNTIKSTCYVVENKLQQAEESHEKFKVEVQKFAKTFDTEDYAKFKNYLHQLKEYVTKLPEASRSIVERKQVYLQHVDESLLQLDKRATGNVTGLSQSINKTGRSNLSYDEKTNSLSSVEKIARSHQLSDVRTSSNQSIDKIDSRQLTKNLKNSNESISKTTDFHHSISNLSLSNQGTKKTIEGFYAYWNELQPTLNPENFTLGELCSVHNLLVTIGASINNTTIELENVIKFQSTEVKSSRSNSLVKVKVKITDSPAVTERTPATQDNIKQIKNIERELKDLQGKVDGSTFLKDGQEYKDIRSALEAHRSTLQRLSLYRNEDLRSSSHDLVKMIDDTLQLLETKTWKSTLNRRSTTETVLNDLLEIGSKAGELIATKPNDEATKKHLIKYRNYVQNLNVSSYNNNIKRTRQDVLEQINNHLASSGNGEKELKQQFRQLKEKVLRFSGAHQNVLYNKLEEDLKDCWKKTGMIHDENEANRIRREIENHLKILEEKSTRDGRYDGSLKRREGIHEKLLNVEQEVKKINAILQSPAAKSKQELMALDGRLSQSNLVLDNLTIVKDKGFGEARQRLYQEIQQYLTYIGEQIALLDKPVEEVVLRKKTVVDLGAEMGKIAKKIQQIESEILTFVGDESCEKFGELDEALIDHTLSLDAFKFEKGTELYDKKMKLLKNIQKCSDVLDERVKETEDIQKLEKKVNEMVMKIDLFGGRAGDEEYNSLEEQVDNLREKLRNIKVNDSLAGRKEKCSKELGECARRLKQVAKSRDYFGEGTIV